MNVTNVLLGKTGFQAKCFARSVLLNQLAFDINRALNRRPEEETPVFDEATQEELQEVFGDNGLPQETPLDLDALIKAHAAAFILLNRAIQEPDPETGRKPEHLVKRRVPLPDAVVANVKRLTQYNLMQAKAEALKLGANFTKREAAIREEAAIEEKRQIAEIKDPWLAAIKEQVHADTEELVDTVLSAMVDAKRDPAAEIRRAADLMRDALRRRLEAGQFAQLDASIYALCSNAGKAKEHPAEGTTVITQEPAGDFDVPMPEAIR